MFNNSSNFIFAHYFDGHGPRHKRMRMNEAAFQSDENYFFDTKSEKKNSKEEEGGVIIFFLEEVVVVGSSSKLSTI